VVKIADEAYASGLVNENSLPLLPFLDDMFARSQFSQGNACNAVAHAAGALEVSAAVPTYAAPGVIALGVN